MMKDILGPAYKLSPERVAEEIHRYFDVQPRETVPPRYASDKHVTITTHISAFDRDTSDTAPEKESFDPEALLETRTWADTGDEQREAVLHLVRDGLRDALGRLDEWVPRSLYGASGNRMVVKLEFDFDSIDNNVLLDQLRADRDMDIAAKELREIHADLKE